MPTVGVAGGELHYERGGGGEPLLLIQGMSGTHFAWGRPFRELLEADFDCVAFDNRGIGYSSPVSEPFSIADMAADTVELMEALGVESAHVLGISMGGMIAQEMALSHPQRIRTLTLGCTYCGGPGSQLMDPVDFQGLAEAMASGDRDRVYRAMWDLNLSPGFRADESRYAEFAGMAAAAPVARQVIELQLRAIAAHDTSARLPQLAVPTLVIHGTEDRVLPVANGHQIASLLPEPTVEILAGVGHLFWWEQPERSAELIRGHALSGAAR